MIWSKKLGLVASLALASVLNAGNVVADWNAIGSTTVIANGGKVPAASTVWLAYAISENIAGRWGTLTAEQRQRGRQVTMADGLIAATALEHGLTLARPT
jgi:hypothetical protein